MLFRSAGCVSVTLIAKDFGWSALRMNEWLHEKGIQFRQGKTWVLYQEYADKGYTVSKTHLCIDENGDSHSKMHTYWTQKGRLFIYELMKAEGFLPVMEREADDRAQ